VLLGTDWGRFVATADSIATLAIVWQGGEAGKPTITHLLLISRLNVGVGEGISG